MKTAFRNADCIAHQDYLDFFIVTLKTNEFWFSSWDEEVQCRNNDTYNKPPRYQRGTSLLMQYGVNANNGDLVAIPIIGKANFKLARYYQGTQYVAVAVLAGMDIGTYNEQCSIQTFPLWAVDALFSAKQ